MIQDAKKGYTIYLGHVLDNESMKVKFDVKDVLDEFGSNGTFAIYFKTPSGSSAYPISSSNFILFDGVLTWTITDDETTEGGLGYCQLKYSVGTKVLMSCLYKVDIKESLLEDGTTPTPWVPWVNQIEGYKNDAVTAKNAAEAAVSHYPQIDSSTKHWKVWQNNAWVDTGVLAEGVEGDDGVGITSITKTGTVGLVDTYTITYTNSTTSTYNVMNGKDGKHGNVIESITKISTVGLVDTYRMLFTDGTHYDYQISNGTVGADGYSPVANVSKVGTTSTITITDKNGTTTANVNDGESGVYVGSSTPPANANVWIDPSGSESTITKEKLSSSVQASLDLADTALQSVPNTYRTSAAQDVIDNAQNTALQPLINQWDEMWELGYINPSTGQDASSSDYARSKGYIKANPSTTYYSYCNGANPCTIIFYGENKNFLSYASGRDTEFTTPSNCAYIRFYTALAKINDISINYPSSFTGYYPSALPKTNAHIGGLGNAIGMKGWNQLLKIPTDSSVTRGGVTFTNNANGSITLNGTCTAESDAYFGLCGTLNVQQGHKVIVLMSGNSNIITVLAVAGWGSITRFNGDEIKTLTHNVKDMYIYCVTGAIYNNVTIWPMLIDLTAIFGAGNEPSSVSDFRSMFGADYYPYCSGSFADLLWTNPSPSASFTGNQTISVDLSSYNYVGISARIFDDEDKIVFSIIPKGSNAPLISATRKMVWRLASPSSNGVTFGHGYQIDTYGTASINTYRVIPYQILGIK